MGAWWFEIHLPTVPEWLYVSISRKWKFLHGPAQRSFKTADSWQEHRLRVTTALRVIFRQRNILFFQSNTVALNIVNFYLMVCHTHTVLSRGVTGYTFRILFIAWQPHKFHHLNRQCFKVHLELVSCTDWKSPTIRTEQQNKVRIVCKVSNTTKQTHEVHLRFLSKKLWPWDRGRCASW